MRVVAGGSLQVCLLHAAILWLCEGRRLLPLTALGGNLGGLRTTSGPAVGFATLHWAHIGWAISGSNARHRMVSNQLPYQLGRIPGVHTARFPG